ncbi:MAG: hypothetical protein Q9165_006157 [Trypethelium subeluteriae]
MTGKYACLSYCWGKSRPFVTTTSNRAQRADGFAIDDLPATLRDAVYFTRNLGLRYLWVDALCILQDDRGDWERESANMNRVYGQSYVTLCASHAADINEGLSTQLDQAQDGPCLLKGTYDGTESSLWVRRELSHHQFISLNDAAPGTWAEDRYPLMERAWALQEHLLSPRVIQFATHEPVWECWEHSSCLCGRLNQSKPARSFVLRPSSSQEGFDELTETWKNVLRAYSSRAATDPGDKLPALSGLAHSLEDRMGSRYLAGLWDRNLVNDLLWYKPPSALKRSPYAIEEYRAPSWSWASVDGHVFYSRGNAVTQEAQIAEIHEAQTVLAGSDSMGAVSGGHVKIRTLMTEIGYEYMNPEVVQHHVTYICRKHDLSSPFHPNWAFELPGSRHVPSGTSFPCIVLGYTNLTMAIVLQKVGSADHTFERIGSFIIGEPEKSKSWFADARMTELTIV